jgi:lipid-A-disaccharide synthase
MGIAEVIAVYPRLSSAAHRLQAELKRRSPDITILIDYPGLNLRLMEDAYHMGSCVVYHIPPKVWAHGIGRITRLRDCTFLVTCILPFEEKLLRHAGINAHFVGNPLKDQIQDLEGRHANILAGKIHHAEVRECIGLVPGSRTGEVERVFPEMIRAFARTRTALNRPLKAVVPVAPTVSQDWLEAILRQTLASEEQNQYSEVPEIEFVQSRPLIEVLQGCQYAWVCSGTAALEVALLGIPHSVVYKMHWLSYSIAQRIVKLPFISLENLCSGREIVPEFIQDKMTAEALSAHALTILKSPERAEHMRSELLALRQLFPPHSAQNAAAAVLDCYLNLPTESSKRFHAKAVRELIIEDEEWGVNR